jgi:hypothetical protein
MNCMHRVLGLLVVLSACQATISNGGGNGDDINSEIDAGGSGSNDASTLGPDAAAIDAAPACALAQSVYLNFEGQALARATASDATQNQAAWMNKANGTAPAFRAGSGTRAADITAITNGVTSALVGFPVAVVTTRPTTGPYMMIVFGGTAAQIGSDFSGAVQKLDCGNQVISDVAWVGDAVTPNQRVINFALGAIGFGVGLTATTDTADCMCGWANNCQQTTLPCTLSPNINRDANAQQTCPNVTTQNEQASIDQAFCP